MRKQTNAGLTENQAVKVLDILRKVGRIDSPLQLAELLGTSPKKLAQFVQTRQAKEAIAEATDLSRLEYYQELKSSVEDTYELRDTATPSHDPSGIELTSKGMRIKDSRDVRRYSRKKEDLEDSVSYIQSQDSTISKDEIAYWDKLADS